MPINITNIMKEFAGSVRKLLGNALERVIVYGSYARGDYSELSDVDVMILVSLTEENFNYWVDNLPFYQNVRDEGVELSA